MNSLFVYSSFRSRVVHRHLALALLPVFIAAPALAQQSDTAVVRVRTVSPWQNDVDKLKRELLAQRALELEFQRMLATLQSQYRLAAVDSQRSELDAQSQLVVSRLRETGSAQLRIRQRLETMCSAVRKPKGWLGVNTTGYQLLDRQEDGTTVLIFLEPPVVASVDPGSPADRVGLLAGDVLMEVGGKRLMDGKVVFAELLRPGERVPVKFQRGREVMTLTPLIEPLPEVTTTPCSWVDAGTAYVLAPMPAQGPVRVEVQTAPDGSRRYAYSYARPGTDSGRMVAATTAPASGGVFAGPMTHIYSGGANSLAGIQLVALSQESSRALGVKHGLLVNQVLPGTPGRESGLQGGDVMVSADSVDLRNIATLQRVISRSADRTVTIVIVRDRKTETIRLRW